MPLNPPLQRKLRMALIGGGRGSFIGRVHVLAARLDGRAELVAGALSSDPVKARASAADYELPTDRAYPSWQELLATEQRRASDERLDFVTIATPNHTHFEIARAFVAAGFAVVCDKPMTIDLAQAEELAALVRQTGVVFAVTHNYTGYPLVRQARERIRHGEIGDVQAVRLHYLQGSLRRQRTPEQQRRAAWKSDPARAGESGCFGDIGIHAYNLFRFVTGQRPDAVSCLLESFEKGPLDDYGMARLQLANGGLATLTASRISHGRENDLRFEIDGIRGSLHWWQEEPHRLWLRRNGQPAELLTPGTNQGFLDAAARAGCRLPAGHPEGFFEAFANIYAAVFDDLCHAGAGQPLPAGDRLYPTVTEGVEGVRFVSRCVASARQQAAWLPWD